MIPTTPLKLGDFSWERMISAVEKVRERMLRAAAALDRGNIPYAVIGGNAVAAWVSRVDEAAVRNTQDVDILLRRSDLEAAASALAEVGFVRHEVLGVEMFLDGPNANPRNAVHVILAEEKVQPNDLIPAPKVEEAERAKDGCLVLRLDALVRMKLTAFRNKDRTHLSDLLDLRLLDAGWVNRLPAELQPRFKLFLDDPTA